MPEAMSEFVGSMGISILRDSEIFISPLSDLQINGFMTISNLTQPTEDGKTAGAVCACGHPRPDSLLPRGDGKSRRRLPLFPAAARVAASGRGACSVTTVLP